MSEWFRNQADRAVDPVYKQHLENYANAIDATHAAWEVVLQHDDTFPDDIEQVKEFQNKHTKLVYNALDCEKDQRAMYMALELYRAKLTGIE